MIICAIVLFFNLLGYSFDFQDFLSNLSQYEDIIQTTTSYIDISDVVVKKSSSAKDFIDFYDELRFSNEKWNRFVDKIERGEIKEEKRVEYPPAVEITTTVKTLGPQVEFIDAGTSLNVTGRKVISLNYSGRRYINEQTTPIRRQSTSNFDITQQLQIRMQGKVGDKITVNVDYDDTKADKQDISIVYQGEPQEVVQSISFGDIDLSLPSTEFVSYNKQLFGIRADVRSGGFSGRFIGSRTKGQTRTKQFKGNTQFRTADIYDTSYIRRKYYSVIFSSPSYLPIKPGSEKVYIDYQTSEPVDEVVISSITADDINFATITYTGKFKLLSRGVDYAIDYNKGEIVFSRSLNPQDVVIIDYQKSDGNWLRDVNGSGRLKILKTYNDVYISDPAEGGWNNEIKTYYSIGQTNIVRDNGLGNFILKVQNLNRQEIGSSLNPVQKYPDTIEVDFEQGIIKLKSPFGSDTDPNIPDPQTYSPSPIAKRIIHVEYYYRINTFFLEPNIVLNSEVIRVDGKKLVKNQDYYIDYDSGFITFYNPNSITPESIIDVYYEISPFGGSDQSLVGGRVSYDLSRYLSLGSTLLYQSSSKRAKAPSIGDISSNMLVYDGDVNLKNLNILGIKASLSFEVAGSVLNPNVSGNAIIDNMESIKQEDLASLDENYWQIASNPSAIPSHAESINWRTVEVYKKDINPLSPDNSKQQVLEIDYDFSISSEVSLVYVFSKTGIDFSKKNSIELIVKGDRDDGGPLINLHFGEIDEDSDGSGGVTLVCSNGRVIYNAPKTEDINCDGILSPDEDKGWLYSPPGGGTRRFGARNGRIDTQDLDGNGRLDRGNPSVGGSFGYAGNNYFVDLTADNIQTHTIDFSSWHNLVFPLVIPSTESYRWANIKVVRISLKKGSNTPIKGKIWLARLGAVGSSWNINLSTNATESLSVYAINNLDNPGYIPLFNAGGIITSEYNKLYGSVREQRSLTGESNIVEQALAITFTSWSLTSTSYIYRRFFSPIDISQHKELRFFIYNKEVDDNARFYLKFGDPSNYFKVSVPLDFVGWRLFTINQVDLNGDGVVDRWVSMDPTVDITTSGVFSLQQVPQIIAGLEVTDHSTHTVTLYLNDIYLSHPLKKIGSARKIQGGFEIPNFASFGGKHRFVDRMFQTPVSAITNQDVEENSGYLTLLKPSFFPTSYTFSRRITNTPNVYNTGSNNLVNLLQQGRVKTEDINARGSLNLWIIPRVDLNYLRNITDYEAIARTDEKHNYSVSSSFSPAFNIFFIPKNVSFSYNYLLNKVSYSTSTLVLLGQSYYNTQEKTTSYNGRMIFNIFKLLEFNPTYSLSQTYENRRFYLAPSISYPKTMQQVAGFTSTLTLFRWLRPSVSYNTTISENSNVNVTTITLGQVSRFYNVGEIKTINRNATGNVNLNISMAEIFPRIKGLRTAVITSNYQLQDGDVWNNVESSFDSKRYLWIRKELTPLSDLAIRQTATMRDSYTTGLRVQPFEGWSLPQRLAPLNTASIVSNLTYSKQDSYSTNLLTRTRNKTLPDVVFSVSQLEEMFKISRWARAVTTNVKYSNNTSQTSGVSEETNRNLGFDLRFYLLNRINTSFNYNTQMGKKKDLRVAQIVSYTRKRSFSLQGSFDIKAYRFTPRFDYSNDFARSTLGSVVTNTTIMTPSLLVRTDLKIPKTIKLPFISETVLDNRIIWTCNLNYTIKTSPISVNENNRLLSFNSSAEVEASKNLRVSLNASIQRFWHRYLKQEDYLSYQLGTNIILQF